MFVEFLLDYSVETNLPNDYFKFTKKLSYAPAELCNVNLLHKFSELLLEVLRTATLKCKS